VTIDKIFEIWFKGNGFWVNEVPNKFPHLTSPLLENLLIPKKFIEKYEFTAKFEGKTFNRPEIMDIKDEMEGKEIMKLEFLQGEKILIKNLI